MEQSRPAAERVRSILQKMERSIDAARQQRLRRDATEVSPHVEPVADETTPPLRLGETSPRLKARPKRPAPVGGYDGGRPFRSQAG